MWAARARVRGRGGVVAIAIVVLLCCPCVAMMGVVVVMTAAVRVVNERSERTTIVISQPTCALQTFPNLPQFRFADFVVV